MEKAFKLVEDYTLNNKTISDFINKLDFTILSDTDRVSRMNSVLEVESFYDGKYKPCNYFFGEYFDEYFNPHIKKTMSLSDKDIICRCLERMADYILFSRGKNGDFDYDEYPILSKHKQYRNIRKETKIDDKNKIEIDKKQEEQKKKEKYKMKEINTYVQVDSRDRIFEKDYKEGTFDSKLPDYVVIRCKFSRGILENEMSKILFETNETIKAIKKEIAQNEQYANEGQEDKFKIILNHKKWISEIRKDEIKIKESKHRYITFKKLETGFPVYRFDEDTGYIDNDGEYKVISENKFDFTDERHIRALIKNYSSLQDYNKKIEEDLYFILHLFNQLINSLSIHDYERDIMHWYLVNDLPITTIKQTERDIARNGERINIGSIVDKVNYKYGMNLDASRISRLIMDKLPREIAKMYKDSYEEFIYTHKLKGKYKSCSRCKEVKLFNKKYFRFRKDKGIYRSECRKCEKVAKNIQKND